MKDKKKSTILSVSPLFYDLARSLLWSFVARIWVIVYWCEQRRIENISYCQHIQVYVGNGRVPERDGYTKCLSNAKQS